MNILKEIARISRKQWFPKSNKTTNSEFLDECVQESE